MSVILDTNVPHGNACDICVEKMSGGCTVTFAADPHGGPETLWFCFQLRHHDNRDRPLGKVRLVLKHLDNMLTAPKPETIRPVYRPNGETWQRLDAGRAEVLPDGRTRAVWEIDTHACRLDVATCYPYGMGEVEALVRETGGFWQADTIGVSQAGRPLVRLSNAPGAEGSDRPGLYLTARQHAAETPGSWVLDGLLRQIATHGEKAPLIWAVPLTNIDGVEQGDYGKDNFPYDLNRAWGVPAMRHEVLIFQRDITRWRRRCRPVGGIDFHGPSLHEATGCYAFLPKPGTYTGVHEASRRWGDRLAAALGSDYAADPFGRVAGYASRWETPTFCSHMASLGLPAMSVETPYSQIEQKVLTPAEYAEIGRRIAAAVMEGL